MNRTFLIVLFTLFLRVFAAEQAEIHYLPQNSEENGIVTSGVMFLLRGEFDWGINIRATVVIEEASGKTSSFTGDLDLHPRACGNKPCDLVKVPTEIMAELMNEKKVTARVVRIMVKSSTMAVAVNDPEAGVHYPIKE